MADRLAETAQEDDIVTETFLTRKLPGKDLTIHVKGDKISGFMRPAATHHWEENVAREHYHGKKINH